MTISFRPSSAPDLTYPCIDMRDYQRSLVYKWERDCLHLDFKKKSTPQEITEFLRQICTFLGVPLRVRFRKGSRSFAYARPDADGYFLISFDNGYGLTPEIVVHELAHILCNQKLIAFIEQHGHKLPRSGHGPEWLTVYMFLLIHCLGYDRDYLINTAAMMKLDFFVEPLKR